MIQKILCPTDLTMNSAAGIAYGLTLAKENRAQLIVFHATSFPCQYPYCELESFREWEQLVSRFKMDRLLAEAERKVKSFVYTNFGVEMNDSAYIVGVALGRAAEEIVTAALREEVDVIVLARRKVRTLTRLFTRSIAATVSRNAPCPVLSIGPAQFIRPLPGCQLPRLEELLQRS
jgi:nucleotide-binding universal stress UspA family protein